eukprot:7842377-Ditylum_brightwellii.AAC.1
MGNSWTKIVSHNNGRLDSSGPSTLKLASQRIVKFSGKINKWQRWKNLTLCAFVGSGYERVLLDWYEAQVQPSSNAIIYSQLPMATLGGMAYHFVKAHK